MHHTAPPWSLLALPPPPHFAPQVDEALFCNEDSKGEQSSAMSELTAQVKEAFAAERGAGEGSEERREDSSEETYSEGDVLVSYNIKILYRYIMSTFDLLID